MTARLVFPSFCCLILLAAAANAQPTDSATMATSLFAAVRNADWKGLHNLLPSVQVLRAIAPTKKIKKSQDKQIEARMQEYIRTEFDNITASASNHGISLKDLEFVRFIVSRPWENHQEGSKKKKKEEMPIAMEITYRWQGREGSLGFSVMEYQGRWYLLEILRSVNIFDKVAPQ